MLPVENCTLNLTVLTSQTHRDRKYNGSYQRFGGEGNRALLSNRYRFHYGMMKSSGDGDGCTYCKCI